MTTTWSERLRPQSWEDIAGQPTFRDHFREWAATGEYPAAILLAGPPGTGKTSAANAIARTMLGDAYNEMNLLWTNASDDRGIGYIRDEVKQFARISGLGVKRKQATLDEADGLTKPSQDALRGIMEKYAGKVLFVLTANNLDKIIPAIRSRCQTYVFDPIDAVSGAERLRALESCGAPSEWEEHYEDVMRMHNGDMRSAIQFLETLPRNPLSLRHYVSAPSMDDEWWNDLVTNQWDSLRQHLITKVDDAASLYYFMQQFHQHVRGHFDDDPETAFAVTYVWGGMFERVNEWLGSSHSFVDVLVARLKKEVEQ